MFWTPTISRGFSTSVCVSLARSTTGTVRMIRFLTSATNVITPRCPDSPTCIPPRSRLGRPLRRMNLQAIRSHSRYLSCVFYRPIPPHIITIPSMPMFEIEWFVAFQGTYRVWKQPGDNGGGGGTVITDIKGSGHHGVDYIGVASVRSGKGYKITGEGIQAVRQV